MSKTVHYVDGCPWADGHIHSADTRQTKDWKKVTCKHCKNKRLPRAMRQGDRFSDYMRAMLVLRSS